VFATISSPANHHNSPAIHQQFTSNSPAFFEQKLTQMAVDKLVPDGQNF
jgi:hypothetical protein